METRSDYESRNKVWDLIQDIKFSLLVTRGEGGAMRARPMVAQQDSFDGELWFFTTEGSRKISDIEQDPNVLLTYAEPGDQNYVSVTGKATIVRDRSKIKELWSEGMRVWFPKGAEDPAIALICVRVDAAEYWDSPSSTMVYAYGYAKARLTGQPPRPGEVRHVDF